MWKFISNEPNKNYSQNEATQICDDKIQKKNRSITKKSPKHTLQIKRENMTYYYREKSFDEFRSMIVYPPQKLGNEESNIFSSSFCISSENQSNEVICKMVLTNILKRCEDNNTQLHPISSVMTP